MPSKITDPKLINNLVLEFKNGMSKKDICEKYNLSPPTVRYLIKENFDQIYSRISENTINSIIECSKSIRSKRKIAEELGIDRNTVSKVLKDKNINLRYGHIHDTHIREKILEDYTRNLLSVEALSKKYSYGKRFIQRLLNENNLRHKINITYSEQDEDWLIYSKLARRLTGTTMRFYNLLSPEGYQWDHKISISDGWRMKIPAELIASRNNLELVETEYNLMKSNKSSISKEDLYKSFGI
jgi:DNA-binding CsgD family transcriptional regulator